MKNIWPVLGCLLLFPVATLGAELSCAGGACAQPSVSGQEFAYGAAEWKMPSDVYTAFLKMPGLLHQQKNLQARGFELTEEELHTLAVYKQSVKGLVMVEVGFPSCRPCRVLVDEMTSTQTHSPSLLQQWQNKGGRFYQLDWTEDAPSRSGKNLSSLWRIESVPVLLFFKDGELEARLNGMNVQNPASSISQIKAYIDSVSR